MRIARVRTANGAARHAVLDGDTAQLIEGDVFSTWKRVGKPFPLNEATLLAPLVPVNILCFGRNYRAHAEEGGASLPTRPLLFLKATSCLNDPEAPIVLPPAAPSQIDFEAELAVVIGMPAYRVSRDQALRHVFGYTCGNDVSARDIQESDGQWSRAKSFDTFGPLGPWIETRLDPGNLRIQGRLNGEVMQDATTAQLVFDVAYLISFLSQGMTLQPGTVLMTGTPAGCGFARKPPVWLAPGDVYEVEIDGIGILRNPVKSA
ncbi:MAG TPA: fumarylacetoacetate hydrolase family protein [Spirochaetia bacterium]|nr:fumarylacetoacetate hydrolase family protein [Spirochaetia bacterium]